MHTTTTAAAEKKLKHLSRQLRQIGRADLAEDVQDLMEVLIPAATRAEEKAEILTIDEAARILGVRSNKVVRRWAAAELLDGIQRGRRLVVLRTSVERMLNSPTVLEQQRREMLAADDLVFFARDEEDIEKPEPWERIAEAGD